MILWAQNSDFFLIQQFYFSGTFICKYTHTLSPQSWCWMDLCACPNLLKQAVWERLVSGMFVLRMRVHSSIALTQSQFHLADVKTFLSFWTFDLGELKIPPVNSCAGSLWKWHLIKQARPRWVLLLSVDKHTRHLLVRAWGTLSLCKPSSLPF